MLLRGFAVLFSMTLVGVYIYNRAGGKLPPMLGGAAPAEDAVLVTPVDDLRFVGSKSAAVFEPATPLPTQPAPQLMPGSKSLVLSPSGSTAAPQAKNSPPDLLPDSKYIVIPRPATLLPGSKADTVIKPSNVDSPSGPSQDNSGPQQAQPVPSKE
jgi:hypothetical protein